MNNKKRFFFTINSILIFIILFVNNYLLSIFSPNNTFLLMFIIAIISIILYLIISNYLVEDIFTLDEKLKYKIETTMHEINTPVSTIKINTEILLSKLNNTKNIQRLNRINLACNNLLELYEDMEYYIKKEIDNIEMTTFNIQDLVKICVKKFDDIKNNINIIQNISKQFITTDKNGFEIVISNLISNAIKHNKNIQNIVISLDNHILTIKDDGDGINSKEIYKIFDKYYQLNNETKGIGLGLSIVKEFCDKNKIDMKINSTKDGTIFKLNLNNILKKD